MKSPYKLSHKSNEIVLPFYNHLIRPKKATGPGRVFLASRDLDWGDPKQGRHENSYSDLLGGFNPLKNIHNLSFQGFFCSMTAGWWYTYPSEK